MRRATTSTGKKKFYPLSSFPLFYPQHTGESRDKKDFSKRQLQLPKHQPMSCRHCNEAEKFAAKEDRRRSLDESKEKHSGEIHNKG